MPSNRSVSSSSPGTSGAATNARFGDRTRGWRTSRAPLPLGELSRDGDRDGLSKAWGTLGDFSVHIHVLMFAGKNRATSAEKGVWTTLSRDQQGSRTQLPAAAIRRSHSPTSMMCKPPIPARPEHARHLMQGKPGHTPCARDMTALSSRFLSCRRTSIASCGEDMPVVPVPTLFGSQRPEKPGRSFASPKPPGDDQTVSEMPHNRNYRANCACKISDSCQVLTPRPTSAARLLAEPWTNNPSFPVALAPGIV